MKDNEMKQEIQNKAKKLAKPKLRQQMNRKDWKLVRN